MKSDGINMRNIGEMYVEKCIREYIEDNKEGILEILEKVSKKADGVDFEKICGEIRDDVCDRIADNFGEERYWDVYWGCCDEVLREVEKVVEEMMESVGEYRK